MGQKIGLVEAKMSWLLQQFVALQEITVHEAKMQFTYDFKISQGVEINRKRKDV